MEATNGDAPMNDAVISAAASSSQDEAASKNYKIDPITALQDGIGKSRIVSLSRFAAAGRFVCAVEL